MTDIDIDNILKAFYLSKDMSGRKFFNFEFRGMNLSIELNDSEIEMILKELNIPQKKSSSEKIN